MSLLEHAVGPFVIDEYRLDGRRIELVYRMGEGQDLIFTEVVEFDTDLRDVPEVHAALRVLHLVAGTSYYKAIAPARILVGPITKAERDLLEAIYDQGLREFAYRNGIEVPLPVDIASNGADEQAGATAPTGNAGQAGPANAAISNVGGERVLIPVGGGKDSALVADLIPDGELMSVNPTGAHRHLADRLGRPLRSVRRTIDPVLRDLVAAGAPNGHVPVTAINSAIAVALAASDGIAHVAMGLERSASEPTVVVDGIEVNHQFSKSAEGERVLSDAFAQTGVHYFSLLRPMTELAIGVAVARRGLLDDIVSCNRAFTIWSENEASRTQKPCGECAKCLFTALMLAPASSPERIEAHFGRPLLDDPDHIESVRQLWSDEKPFDCVGERHETAAALVLLSRLPEWSTQVVPSVLGAEATAILAESGAEPEEFLAISEADHLPRRFAQLVDSLRSA